jgi:hypothetical protein
MSYSQARGEGNSNWKGGRCYSHGYILVYCPDHPHPNHLDGYVFEHRLVMGRKIGRYLRPNEVVHHKDGQRDNNDPNNLVLLTKIEHDRLHGFARRGMKFRNASSRYRGVSWYKYSGKWKAAVNYREGNRPCCKHVGYFNSEIEAAKAFDKAAKEILGTDAVLNFPD